MNLLWCRRNAVADLRELISFGPARPAEVSATEPVAVPPAPRQSFAVVRRALVTQRRRAAFGGIGASIVLIPAGFPVQAHAGYYFMRNCHVPGYPNAPTGPWRSAASPTTAAFDSCLSGGGFGIALPGVRQMYRGNTATYDLVTPATGPQSAIRLAKIALWFDARTAGSGSPVNAIRYTRNADGAVFGGVVYESPNGDGYTQTDVLQSDRTVAYSFGIACYGGSADCFPDDATPLRITGAQVTLREDVAPSAGIVGGTLLQAGPQGGVRSVEYTASDLQSGLMRFELLIDENVVASRDLAARCTYSDFAVCPDADRAALLVDTRAVPDGSHAVALRVSDAAGNQELIRPARAVQIKNQDSPEAVGAPGATSGSQLTARFKGSSKESISLSYSGRAVIRGRLTTGSRDALGHAPIEIFERESRRGAPEVDLGSLQTGNDGQFSYTVAPRRPSRSLRFVYAGDRVGSRALKVRVRAASTLRASLRGVTIRFRGRVISAPLPAAGKRVVLEGKAPGFDWARFAAVRADSSGRFSGSYRIAVRRHGVRLQIRVIVPAQRNYPYLSYVSAPITLRVR